METELCKSILVLTKSVFLLSGSKPQNHNKNTERFNMQPAQRLLSCLFCLLSERRESHRETERERLLQIPHIKNNFYSSVVKRQKRSYFVAVEVEASL